MSYRVVQWATGNQGVEAIRAILDRPDLELVGAKVYSPDKEGVDAGVLAGRKPCGVTATQDIDDILALGADTPRSTRSAGSWPVAPMSPPRRSCSIPGTFPPTTWPDSKRRVPKGTRLSTEPVSTPGT
jgi:hypothetical protein